jgi:hypothetical protein
MTHRRLGAFLDAVAAGRRPRKVRLDPQEAPLAGTAIGLRAARPGEAAPTEAFVAGLHQRLAAEAASRDAPARPASPVRRCRIALVAAAASAVLVGGSVAVTEAFVGSGATSVASHAPGTDVLRTGTFQTAGNQVLGQIVAYRGRPSWVFMTVDVPRYEGRITCELQVRDGSTVSFGHFAMRRGAGQFSKILRVDVRRLRGARLVSPTGAVVATATFS